MPFSKLNLPLKIQGGTLCLMTQYFFLSQYFECKQADIEWILNTVSKNYCLQILRPGEGVERVFILDFYVSVASNMCNLGFKGLLHILMNPIFFVLFSCSSHIASSCNITSV